MRPLRLLHRGALALALTVPLALAPGALAGPATAAPAPGPRAAVDHTAGQAAGDRPATLPDRIALPDGFAPEGIAVAGHTAYLGSRVDGDLYKVDLRTGRGRVFSQGPGTPSLGIKVRGGLLYVAGGTSGTGRIVDARTGAVKRSITFTTGTSFVNDVILTRTTAWFTDSLQAQLYGVPLARHGKPGSARVITLPLTGQWRQTPEVNNANGITRTPDGRALLVVKSDEGALYRVDPRTGRATKVDLGGESVTNGDGLLLRGRTLLVVQNRLNQVAEITLDRSGRRGVVERRLTSSQFDVPTTVAARGRSLYLPNARFSTTVTPTTSYWITRITV
ncbi:sugar lactone lactonase YvrE [Friedmanniella endophytica]|uniref:Sugar lactone lactonase YvrE n=1 Tax=Microlunatus kandeliicorticis TaxID=1759536 RepID=A0A7W3IQ24_9ACTN|nr:superoxide dismutase [Microlunatus kandeliicorticis]MBA8793157.1 sugar lactone lactonase YvrE [Microlunatus kandeliicorticis]